MGVDISVGAMIGFHLPISYFDKYKRSTEGKFHMGRRWDQYTGKELIKEQVWDEEPIEGYSLEETTDPDLIEDILDHFINSFVGEFDIDCLYVVDTVHDRIIFGIDPPTNGDNTQPLYYVEEGANQCSNTETDMDIEIGNFYGLANAIDELRTKLESSGWERAGQRPRIYTHMEVS